VGNILFVPIHFNSSSIEYQKIRTFRTCTASRITRYVMASAPNAYKIRQDR